MCVAHDRPERGQAVQWQIRQRTENREVDSEGNTGKKAKQWIRQGAESSVAAWL